MKNYYETLGIPRYSSLDEVKKAYRRLAHKYHPDKNKSGAHGEEFYRQIKEAYDFLSSPLKKKDYDLTLRTLSTPISPYSFTRYTSPAHFGETIGEPSEKQEVTKEAPSSKIWTWLKPIIIIILSIIAMYLIMK